MRTFSPRGVTAIDIEFFLYVFLQPSRLFVPKEGDEDLDLSRSKERRRPLRHCDMRALAYS